MNSKEELNTARIKLTEKFDAETAEAIIKDHTTMAFVEPEIENPVRTKGDVIVNTIEVGDVHYEYEYGMGIRSTVLTKPVRSGPDDDGDYNWEWKSKTHSGEVINYLVTEGFSHYSANLYTYPAYGLDIVE